MRDGVPGCRSHTPDALYARGLVVRKAKDCGDNEWHYQGAPMDACYHCDVRRSTPPDAARADSVG
jgi:hypothetical protein